MSRHSLKIDTLDRIVTASNERELAESALMAVKELVVGAYYSALTCDLKSLRTELLHPEEGWLGSSHPLVQNIQRTHAQHPFVQNFFPQAQSAIYCRSHLLSDREWQRTEAYNEVDRPLGILDMVGIYHTTAAGQLLIVTVGRSRQFRAADLEPVRKFQQLLKALPISRTTADSLLDAPGHAAHLQDAQPPVGADERRLIPAGHSGFLVEPAQILCITADGNFSTITTVDRRKIKVRQTLEGWLAVLPAGAFLQTDRATIINLRQVRQVDFGGHCATVCFGVPVPTLTLGRNAALRIKQALRPGQ